MSNTSTAASKLADLREKMTQESLDGFIVPRADEFQGEFVAPYAERLFWLSGFSGSGGAAIVLKDKAAVLTDGRYSIQIKQEIDLNLFEAVDITKTSVGAWLEKHAKKGGVIGYDPMLLTASQIQSMEQKVQERGIILKPVNHNLIDQIWTDQPPKPLGLAELFPEAIAGQSYQDKFKAVRSILSEQNVEGCVLTLPDSIAWLLNIRGNDISYIPQCLSYFIVNADGSASEWFVEPEKITPEIKEFFKDQILFYHPEKLPECLMDMTGRSLAAEKMVALDEASAPVWFKACLESAGANILNIKDPTIPLKAIKTAAEQEAIRQTHIHDGAALVKLLHWAETKALEEGATELDVAHKLHEMRGQDPAYRGPSFPEICGFGPNGAIVHYHATQEIAIPLAEGGLLLTDSGGQYHDGTFAGTTDITRIVPFGKPTQDMIRMFTLVLKGHIALANAKFPAGTTGAQIDTLARQPLWNEKQDYAHGTGHGVGCYLAVHEEAASISSRGKIPFEPGMLISNEPGYYEEGAYGIRIENLVLVQENGRCAATGRPLYGFETVSLAPIETTLIDKTLLSLEELEWLNKYHADVYEKLSPLLSADLQEWLKEKTTAI